jgi:hypothetical protein
MAYINLTLCVISPGCFQSCIHEAIFHFFKYSKWGAVNDEIFRGEEIM